MIVFFPPALSVVALVVAMVWFWGFVQDDAFISLRYAYNLAYGRGLVFNPAERVEGFTNLAWTLMEACATRAGLPPLLCARLLGCLTALALTILVWWAAGGRSWRIDRRAPWCAGLAALLVASSTSLAVWAVSGLEQTAFTFLVFAGFCCFSRSRFRAAAAIWLVATLTRPEGALAFGLAVLVRGGALLWLRRAPSRTEWNVLGLYVAGFAALFLFRFTYYGSPVPNTFYVKGMSNWYTFLHGLSELKKYLLFDSAWATLLVASLGLAGTLWMPPRGLSGVARDDDRTGREEDPTPKPGSGGPSTPARPTALVEEAVYSAAFLALFLYYMVRIGGDLLPMFRLYLPVLPFAAVWAARAVDWTWDLVLVRREELDGGKVRPRSAGALMGATLSMALLAVVCDGWYTSWSHPEYKGSDEALMRCHGAVGQYLEEQARAHRGARPLTAVAQDMGLTPYLAPSVRFVDVIGLTDSTVARTLYRYDYNPYTRYLMWAEAERRSRIEQMEGELREYLERQNADYVVVNINCEVNETEPVRQAMARLDGEFLNPYTTANSFYYGFPAAPAFRRGYRLVKGFEFSAVHFILLFKKQQDR